MNRGKKFAKITAIYAIGNFGSMVLTFLMVPYYTHNIPTGEYGIYDVLLVTISLIMPVLTLQTQEAIIAGMIDKKKDSHQIIKCTLSIVLVNSLAFAALYFLINQFISIQYGVYFITLLTIKSIYTVIHQYARGLSRTGLYAASGLVYTLVFLGLNIIQLSVLHTGIQGLLISETIASIVAIVIITVGAPEIIRAIRVKIDKSELSRIIHYSMPLIPNNISWWLINASDRYVIGIFLGSVSNGIYAISYKFANIIQTVTSLVYLAWQEISLEEYKSKDKDVFYSSFFNSYMKLLLSGVLVAICCTKFVTMTFLAEGYFDAWKYTSWLYMGIAYSSLAAFLNTCYLANGETGEILKGTLLAGVINLVVDVALIKLIGVYAASLSTVVSAFVLLIRRIVDNKKYYKLVVDWKILGGLTVLCSAYSMLILLTDKYILDFCLLVPAIFITLILNKSLIQMIIKKALKRT
jgi:O-antigen/teichoic acid export membrane protein